MSQDRASMARGDPTAAARMTTVLPSATPGVMSVHKGAFRSEPQDAT